MTLSVGGAEDVEENTVGRESTNHDFLRVVEKQLTGSVYYSDPRTQ